ncbi:MAG: TadE family protein [Rubripirellula sp.]
MISRPKRTFRSKSRRAVAAVEFAVCLPILTLVVFGTIEMSHGIFAKQAGTAAAYEAARLATSSGGTEVAARQRADEVLNAMNIDGGTVQITPEVNAAMSRGTVVTVTVEIPSELNSSGLNFIMPSRQITTSIAMVKL